ncbi:hypothetical protein L7F22_062908 [Adiantum nelumboides]|nr:hypothetical protein [Adiantum nelumboides]
MHSFTTVKHYPGQYWGNSQQQQLEHYPKMDWHTCLGILLGIAKGLAYLHHEYDGKRSVVHGDLTPGNVLLDAKMEAHIADFGLARIVTATNTTSMPTPSQRRVVSLRGHWWSFSYTAPVRTARRGVLQVRRVQFGGDDAGNVDGGEAEQRKAGRGADIGRVGGRGIIAAAATDPRGSRRGIIGFLLPRLRGLSSPFRLLPTVARLYHGVALP